MEYSEEFLWLPKQINGKWYWLKKVTVQHIREYMCIDGKTVTFIRKKYIV